MKFGEITSGEKVFVDANTFVYHFIAEPKFGPASTALLRRIEFGDIVGWTSPHILAELCHRLMMIEACKQFGWPSTGVVARLRRDPTCFRQLSLHRQAIATTKLFGLHIVGVLPSHIAEAAAICCSHGLLTNDAIVVSLMNEKQIRLLASNDSDFDRVPNITRCTPV